MEPKYLMHEEYEEYPAPGCVSCYIIKKWVFYYSDGSVETITTKN